MDRRRFLESGLAAGAAMAAGARAVPAAAAADGPAAPADDSLPAPTRVRDFEFEEITVAALQEGVTSGRWTAESVVKAYLARIEDVDRQGPELRAVLETNPEAVAQAKASDAERKERGARGPLHGVPVLLKDNIDTADRMTTTAGSLALEGHVAAEDSFVAKRLREAGAILLAKANLSEWANFRSTRSTSGWSARGGQCRNPYVLDRNPCGSSSGSGAGVSAGLGAVAIGTETDGSIVCPSSHCGVVGLKPTLGLVSRAGIIPIAHSQDTAGPMTRTVTDAAIVLGAIAGPDPKDTATAEAGEHAFPDYTRFLDPNGLQGARIGVARALAGFDPNVDALFEAALDELKRGGAELVDPVEVPGYDAYGEAELTVLLYEFKTDLNAYLANLGDGARVRSLADLIRFNEENREREMPFFGQELFVQAEAKGTLASAEYRKARRKCLDVVRRKGLDAALSKHRLDAIVAPTGGPAWVTDPVNGDHYGGGSSSLAAVAGYPNLTVPMGFVRHLPVGISFFGAAWSEPVLLRIGYAYEQATQHRRAPRFLTTLGH